MNNFQKVSYKSLYSCNICGNIFKNPTLSFPRLPLTEIYMNHKPLKKIGFVDQCFYYCSICGHGQLGNIIPKEILYTQESYYLRTSQSTTACSANDYFADFIQSVIGKKKFNTILEFGCSDLYLLEKLESYAQKLVGVDPILRNTQKKKNYRIQMIGDFIESLDMSTVLSSKNNMILSSHTMEHIENPKQIVQFLFDACDESDLFIFQFPSLEPLVKDQNYDQIFHQHLHYFSISSFTYLIERCGGEIVDYQVNPYHWGALMVAFRKRKGPKKSKKTFLPFQVKDIQFGYDQFQKELRVTTEKLHRYKDEKLYGFGASLMLPILGYHLGTDFVEFESILDDDKAKEGLYYINLPVKIRKPAENEYFGDANILVTAYNTPRSVISRVISLKPKRIIFSRNVI
jgi:hypothetical protein